MANNPYLQQQQHVLTYARADLNAETFDDLIRQKGFWVIWQQGLFCPCVGEENGQANYNCPLCKGKGYIYINATKTKLLVTSISGRKEQDRIGLNEQGTSYATPLSTDNVGFRDRFTFIDFKMKYSEVFTKSDSNIDELTYGALNVILLRDTNTIYKRGIDFNIEENKPMIKWINPSVIPGTRLSILYVVHPVYIAINPIHELRGTYNMKNAGGLEYFVQLPSQYQIKREDFLGQDDI